MLRERLAHPLIKNRNIDAPETTILKRRLILEKPFLKKLYTEWYKALLSEIPALDGKILELGSGAGFLKDIEPSVVTSEVFECEGIDCRIDACRHLPFADRELTAIVMTDVFHHLPDIPAFFGEASRAVQPGGKISMIEPWVTPWSRLIYGKLHHEPFTPESPDWRFESEGPLSGANGALPWIVFCRDKGKFELKHPEWKIEKIELLMPFSYLLSGGVSMRALLPGWGYSIVRSFEKCFSVLNNKLAMFAHITLRKE